MSNGSMHESFHLFIFVPVCRLKQRIRELEDQIASGGSTREAPTLSAATLLGSIAARLVLVKLAAMDIVVPCSRAPRIASNSTPSQ